MYLVYVKLIFVDLTPGHACVMTHVSLSPNSITSFSHHKSMATLASEVARLGYIVRIMSKARGPIPCLKLDRDLGLQLVRWGRRCMYACFNVSEVDIHNEASLALPFVAMLTPALLAMNNCGNSKRQVTLEVQKYIGANKVAVSKGRPDFLLTNNKGIITAVIEMKTPQTMLREKSRVQHAAQLLAVVHENNKRIPPRAKTTIIRGCITTGDSFQLTEGSLKANSKGGFTFDVQFYEPFNIFERFPSNSLNVVGRFEDRMLTFYSFLIPELVHATCSCFNIMDDVVEHMIGKGYNCKRSRAESYARGLAICKKKLKTSNAENMRKERKIVRQAATIARQAATIARLAASNARLAATIARLKKTKSCASKR